MKSATNPPTYTVIYHMSKYMASKDKSKTISVEALDKLDNQGFFYIKLTTKGNTNYRACLSHELCSNTLIDFNANKLLLERTLNTCY